MFIRLSIITLLGALFVWKVLPSLLPHHEKSVTLIQEPPLDVSYEQSMARSYLNEIREAMGMNALLKNKSLSTAAQAHADYLIANDEESHDEISGHTGFTGTRPMDRALSANYLSRAVSENLSTGNKDAEHAVNSLFSAIYHRFSFLSPDIDELGVGVAEKRSQGKPNAFVFLMGNRQREKLCHKPSYSGYGKYVYKVCKDEEHHIDAQAFDKVNDWISSSNPKRIVYPYDGQKEVSPVFYAEVPDPLPNYEVSGFPISIAFNPYFAKETIRLDSFRLFDAQGNEVTEVKLMDKNSDPHGHFSEYEYALFPLKRLDFNTQYRVEVSYHIGEKEEQMSWSFATKKFDIPLHRIEGTQEEILLDRKQAQHVLYFEPVDGHDMLKDIEFPEDIRIEIIDNNTLKVVFSSTESDNFEIRSGTRSLHVRVE